LLVVAERKTSSRDRLFCIGDFNRIFYEEECR